MLALQEWRAICKYRSSRTEVLRNWKWVGQVGKPALRTAQALVFGFILNQPIPSIRITVRPHRRNPDEMFEESDGNGLKGEAL